MTGGGSGGQQASPPTLDVNQSAQLFERQLQLQQKYLPGMVATAGTASRGQDAEAVRFGLGMLTNPGATIYGSQISSANKAAQAAQDRVAALRSAQRSGPAGIFGVSVANQYLDPTRGWRPMSELQGEIKKAQNQLKAQQSRVAKLRKADPVADLRRALPQEFAARDRLLGQIGAAQKSSAEYRRAQEAMAAGLGRGELGESLYQTALTRAQSQGQLTPEANRDAVQAARSGMAARGMATGNAAIGAELLNRDRYSRARMAEDLAFAGGVQANEQARQQFNIGLLGQASQMSDAERARQLSLGQDAYNFGLSTNPRMMLAGLGSPYANMTAPAMQMVAGARGLEPMYSGGQFSSGNQGMNMLAGGLGGALSGAAAGTAINPGLGTAIGGALGLGAGLLGSFR